MWCLEGSFTSIQTPVLIDVFYKQLNPITIFLCANICVCVYNNKSMDISISMCERMKLMYVSSVVSDGVVTVQSSCSCSDLRNLAVNRVQMARDVRNIAGGLLQTETEKSINYALMKLWHSQHSYTLYVLVHIFIWSYFIFKVINRSTQGKRRWMFVEVWKSNLRSETCAWCENEWFSRILIILLSCYYIDDIHTRLAL